MTTTSVDFDDLHTALRRALRHGARAAVLVRHPHLVDLLTPASGTEDAPHLADRALATTELISRAVEALDPPADRVMGIMLRLRPGTSRMSLTTRRAHAARLLGVQPETFRTEEQHEQAYLTELALALYQQARRP